MRDPLLPRLFFFKGTIVWAHGCLSRCVLLVTVHHCVEVYKQVHVLETVCPIELKDAAHQVLAQGVTRDASFLAAGTSSCHLLSTCPQKDGTFVHETTRQAKLLWHSVLSLTVATTTTV